MDFLEWITLGLAFFTIVLVALIAFRLTRFKLPQIDAISEKMIRLESSIERLSRIEPLLENQGRQLREEMVLLRNEQLNRSTGFEQTLMQKLLQISAAQQEQLTGITRTNNEVTAKMTDTISLRLNELSKRLTEFEQSLLLKMTQMGSAQQEQLTQITRTNNEVVSKMGDTVTLMLGEQSKRSTEFEQALVQKINQMGISQQEQLGTITRTNNEVVSKMIETVDRKISELRDSVAVKLREIQEDNSKKLEKMRETVDEKLHKTLEERLGQSFALVSERLELVQKGLGEMQNLAIGVGDLKKVLTNVKTRGTMGEYQLGAILEQILSSDQYAANVRTNPHSQDVVEFAIRLPGKDSDGGCVYLPVDSKFPIESYYLLLEAYDTGSPEEIEAKRKGLEAAIKKSARDIHDKYIYSPDTTDFGILFVPVEGLYAEVVRRPQLLEVLQRDMKIVVAGPTTFAALLNSLQMGFRTLAIEKRSSEVWRLLAAVKTEFGKFGAVLDSAQKKINSAGSELEKLVGARSKKIINQLGKVDQMKPLESKKTRLIGAVNLLDDMNDEGEVNNEVDPLDDLIGQEDDD